MEDKEITYIEVFHFRCGGFVFLYIFLFSFSSTLFFFLALFLDLGLLDLVMISNAFCDGVLFFSRGLIYLLLFFLLCMALVWDLLIAILLLEY